jgi:hypothetical protein
MKGENSREEKLMQRPTTRSRLFVAATAMLGLTALVAAYTTIGFASPAAVQYAPQNSAVPTVSCDAKAGSTLTTTNGSWTSSAGGVTYTYQWQRCNSAGASCANISAATKQAYVVAAADVGNRLRSAVTARNNDGSSTAVSAPTAVVETAGPAGQIRLSNGQISIPASSVAPPTRLVVDDIEFSPTPIRSRNPFQARFRVLDTRGFVVRDAIVYASAIPFARIVQPAEVRSDSNGWATMTIQPTRLLPLRNGYLLTMFTRARKEGDDVLAGVSGRRLISVRTANPS